MAESARREDSAGAGAAGRAAELGGDRLHLGGVVADGKLGERLHRGLERRRDGGPEEGEADAHETLVRPQLERDELAGVGGRGQADDERVIGGRAEHAGRDVGDLHGGLAR